MAASAVNTWEASPSAERFPEPFASDSPLPARCHGSGDGSFLEFHTDSAVSHAHFCVWLLSFSIMCLRFENSTFNFLLWKISNMYQTREICHVSISHIH